MRGGGKVIRVLAVLSAAGLAAGVASATVRNNTGTAAGTTRAATPTVKVKLVDFKLLPSVKRVAPGKVTFVVRNAGAVPHEFVVLKTSKAAAKLAVKNGKAVETGRVVRIGAFKHGVTKTVTLTLKAGHYVLLCNLRGHYKAGQFANLTVGAGVIVAPPPVPPPPLDPAKVKAGDLLYHNGPAGLGYGCARCHGQLAQGGTGPRIVGKSASTIQQAIGFVGQMQAFSELSDDQIQNIAAYLQSLQQ